MYINREDFTKNNEARLHKQAKELRNSGINVDITTLTAIKAQVTEQKFYEARPSEYMPVPVGQNAWAADIATWKSYSVGDDFEKGLFAAGSEASRTESGDVQFELVRVPTQFWKSAAGYNIAELNQASLTGNWSLIEAKETARFKSWQLGIQQSAFLGLKTNTAIEGLLTQSNVTVNTTVIPTFISLMTATQFQSFLAAVLFAYSDNANGTVFPDTFTIPMEDYLGLVNSVDESFGIKDRITRLEEAFRKGTRNPDFQIMPLFYCDKAKNAGYGNLSATGKNRYVLYRRNDATSLSMEIPVDYMSTAYDTLDNFHYQSVGLGQFSSVKAFREKEMIYFDHEV